MSLEMQMTQTDDINKFHKVTTFPGGTLVS